MRIELLDHIMIHQGKRVAPPLDYARVSFGTGEPPREMQADPYWIEYFGTVEAFFRQIGQSGETEMMGERARRALADYIFGSIEAEIRAAIREMWAEGRHDSKALKQLEAMLPVLRGEQNGAETARHKGE